MSLYRNRRALGLCFVLAVLVLVSSLACSGEKEPAATPPIAQKKPVVDTFHTEIRADDYFWLRDESRSDSMVIAYLNAENAYTDSMMAHTEEFQEELFQEIKGRIKETDMNVPYRLDDYYYYTRTEEGKQYSIFCRKKGSLDAEEEVYLDQNKLSEGFKYYDLGSVQISPNHKMVAYSVDTSGYERFTLFIKDLETGELLTDRLTDISYSVVWANDNKTLFYTVRDQANRPYKVFRHSLGTVQQDDAMVFHETDDRFWVGVGKTKSEEYIFIGLGSANTSEYYFMKADNPMGKFKLFAPRKYEVEYNLDHHHDHFYVLTNEDAQNFKIMRMPVDKIARENWEEVIAHRKDVTINGFDLFEDYMVVYERKEGLEHLRVMNLDNDEDYYIEFDEPVYGLSGAENPEFDSKFLRFAYYSLTTPNSVYDYNMETRERELLKQREVLGGYSPDDYVSERIWATGHDGVKIPISLVYRQGKLLKDGSNPFYMYTYGSYGNTIDPYFSSSRLSLLDRGFVFGIAHIRGGGAMGRAWYDEGKLLKKKNTFYDLISCAEHVIEEKYTSKDNLIISGGSAGGLTVGAAMNMRPDLFEIVVANVPFVDVVNTMMDSSIPLTVVEYDEWGNPYDEEYYDYIRSYSPYDNVVEQGYPTTLITTSLYDPRVGYWEPAKWTAKLRDMKTDDNVLLFKIDMKAGHGGASGRYDYLRELAFEYAFILNHFGILE